MAVPAPLFLHVPLVDLNLIERAIKEVQRFGISLEFERHELPPLNSAITFSAISDHLVRIKAILVLPPFAPFIKVLMDLQPLATILQADRNDLPELKRGQFIRIAQYDQSLITSLLGKIDRFIESGRRNNRFAVHSFAKELDVCIKEIKHACDVLHKKTCVFFTFAPRSPSPNRRTFSHE